MRLLFLLLLAANAALFAWSQYVSRADGASDPEPARRQLQPDKIRVLQGKELAGLTGTAPAPAPAPKPAASPGPAPASPAACLEWGGFAPAEALKAEQALAPLALGARLAQRRSEETAGWWVFIPPQGSRAGALKKTAELKAIGVEEFFVLQDEGKMRWAVSLGVFSTEEAARKRLEELRVRGVRTAQTGERDTPVAKVWLQLRGADAPLAAKFREAAQAFAGTEVRDCPP
jgi:SPOR domain